jgi:hypothetical protein
MRRKRVNFSEWLNFFGIEMRKASKGIKIPSEASYGHLPGNPYHKMLRKVRGLGFEFY